MEFIDKYIREVAVRNIHAENRLAVSAHGDAPCNSNLINVELSSSYDQVEILSSFLFEGIFNELLELSFLDVGCRYCHETPSVSFLKLSILRLAEGLLIQISDIV